MYRKRRQHRINPSDVVEFLVLDRQFPRAIQYCFLQAEKSLQQITGTQPGTWQNSVDRELGRLRSELDYLMVDEILQRGLHEFLDNLQRRINLVGDKMFETFFTLESVAEFVSLSQSQAS
jgi:uncharacterized alpha-E superfamily protein